MSMLQDQQPPPVTITQQSYNNSHSVHGSIGPVIAVLVVIIILGIIAVMIGRLCSGRRIMGYGQYHIESWMERKCSSCIDGRINPPTPPPRPNVSVPASMPVQTQPETKQEEHSP